ncbi:MAG: hypothetical protein ACPGWS_07615, partial [Solirubrobacterales bacterium]
MAKVRRRRAAARKSPARKRRTVSSKRRTARRNPARKAASKKRTARKAAPKRAARKAAPRRRVRRNPVTEAQRKAAQSMAGQTSEHSKVVAEAKRRGLKASGTTSEIKGRINAQKRYEAKKAGAGRKPAGRKPARRTKKRTPAQIKAARQRNARKAAKARRTTGKHSTSARRILKGKKPPSRKTKAGRTKVAHQTRNRRRIARGYLKARGVSKAVTHMSAENKKLAKAYGLTKINPGYKGMIKDVKAMVVPTILPAAGGFVVGAGAGQVLGTMIGDKVAFVAARPALKRAMVPSTTAALTVGAFMALKRTKKMQTAAMPVLVGGGIATIVHWLLHTLTGQKVASALRLPLALSQASEAQVAQVAADAASGKQPTAGGMASYVSVRQYLGEAMMDPQGSSWYGRGDMGEYVDAGPQNAFGAYVANDFPVHSPGPGDNDNTFAQLGAYETPEYALEETPGGTVMSGVGGIFER